MDIVLTSIDWLIVVAGIVVSLVAAFHALLHHRKPQSAVTWVAVCIMWPVVGAILYFMFGKNRVVTRAKQLHGSRQVLSIPLRVFDELDPSYHSLNHLSQTVTGRDLVSNNKIVPLYNAEHVYSRMLEAINNSKTTVYLLTYIFDYKGIGVDFVAALAAAKERGVEVKVLIDGVGKLYSSPTASSKLRNLGVHVATYLPPKLIPPKFTLNLRNHRKLLIVDQRVAFTGGMNIRASYLGEGSLQSKVRDIHFQLEGAVVNQLTKVFCADWSFCSEIPIFPEEVTGSLIDNGSAHCRVIEAGPNEDIDKLVRVLIGAIGSAQRRIAIMTPYFLPPRELELALQTAVLRGVQVDVLMPENNNLPIVQWASNHAIGDILNIGVNCYLQPGPFVHSKLFIVDDTYVQIGSANIDPRSLRLNFELAVEIYDLALAKQLLNHFDESLALSKAISFEALQRRNWFLRVRDALSWLLSPYL